MKDTIFTEILYSWGKLNVGERIRILQNYENFNSSIEGRNPREVVYRKTDEKSNLYDAQAAYLYSEPDKIVLYSMSDDPVEMMSHIKHEGFHASVDDFVTGKTDLKLLAKIDKKRFLEEKELQHIIHNRYSVQDQLMIFSLCFYE